MGQIVQVDQGVGVLVLLQQVVEEVAASAEDDLVRHDLFAVATNQGDITEVGVFEQASKGFSRESIEVGSFESQPQVIHLVTLSRAPYTHTYLCPWAH